MNSEDKKKSDCPSGAYCISGGKNKCNKLNLSKHAPFCNKFLFFLQRKRNGDVIRCDDCRLEEILKDVNRI